MKSPVHIKYNGLRIFTVKTHGEHTGSRGTDREAENRRREEKGTFLSNLH